jgi:hypothetical protein
MQLTGNLLVLGDSFCEHANQWPAYCAWLLGYSKEQVYVSGQPGASWWPIRGQLLDKLNNDFKDTVTQIIIIHPCPSRIITGHVSLRDNTSAILPLKFDNTSFSESLLASSLYYKYIVDNKFHCWTEQAWFKELNHTVGNIPILHLFTTDESIANANLLQGKKVLQPLTPMALTVGPDRADLGRDDGMPNHFTLKHNRVFGRQVAEIIQGNRNEFDLKEFIK